MMPMVKLSHRLGHLHDSMTTSVRNEEKRPLNVTVVDLKERSEELRPYIFFPLTLLRIFTL
jgi:hypothetical protein